MNTGQRDKRELYPFILDGESGRERPALDVYRK
jgi:hypothetical protein